PGLDRASMPPDPSLVLWRPEGDGLLMATRSVSGNGERRVKKSLYDWLAMEEKSNDDNELKRLFYVAATRAIRSLWLYASLGDEGVRDDTEPEPPKGSMLAAIWPAVRSEARILQAPADGAHEDRHASRTLHRLPLDYAWHPPVELSEVLSPAVKGEAASKRASVDDPIGDRWQVALGTLVHNEMKVLGEGPRLPEADECQSYLQRRAPRWRRWAEHQGFTADDRSKIAGETGRQVALVLADATGRWLLGAAGESECEFACTSVIDGEVHDVVIDRTFVEPDGRRWIVDYKSSVPLSGSSSESSSVPFSESSSVPSSGLPSAASDRRATDTFVDTSMIDSFIAEEVKRYLPQMMRYARVMHRYDSRPLSVALYFTSLPRLVEIDLDL
ncbi:MAG: hypothetical protein O7H39_01435, partial [Gammaproteobacteria bacterium]|nr:hypothetical protein [Gammaproteobacteria bacterium]